MKWYTVIYTIRIGCRGASIVLKAYIRSSPKRLEANLLRKFDHAVWLVFEGKIKPIKDWGKL